MYYVLVSSYVAGVCLRLFWTCVLPVIGLAALFGVSPV